MRTGAVILLEDEAGRLAWQLRDNRPEVSYADHWGLFGGWQEAGETPLDCIRREVQEELGLALEAEQLTYLDQYVEGEIGAHVFRCPAPAALRTAVLREGQRWAWWRMEELAGLRVVPRHRAIVERYAAR
jgi:8-oxo-dGTP diphosphatase